MGWDKDEDRMGWGMGMGWGWEWEWHEMEMRTRTEMLWEWGQGQGWEHGWDREEESFVLCQLCAGCLEEGRAKLLTLPSPAVHITHPPFPAGSNQWLLQCPCPRGPPSLPHCALC